MPFVNKKSNANLLLYTFIGLLIIGIGGWAYSQLEYRIEKKDKGYQGEAITNPYLAAEFFLRRMGQAAVKIKLFDTKPLQLSQSDTLMVPSVRLAFDKRRSEYVLDWVKTGGHLIITGQVLAESGSTRGDYILDKLGLGIQRQVLKEGSSQADTPVSVAIADEDDFWLLDFDDYLSIHKKDIFDSEVVWEIIDDDRMHALQIKIGKGRLTLLSDLRLFRNDYIERYDHAAFLFSLTNDQFMAENTGTFYYSLFDDQASLLKWLWSNAWPFMVSLLFLILVVLWMLIPRFGPLINLNKPVRRQFLEHLTASGNYHWRQGHYNYLLSEVRKQLSHKVMLKCPEWDVLSKQQKILYFSELSKLEPLAVEKALFETDDIKLNDFINKIKILEKLRKNL